MSKPKLTYGFYLSTKRLMHIDDADNGLACGCVCPECGDKLEAVNNGRKRAHHFRHSNGADCPNARMSALHMLAEQVFAEYKKICLPNYEIYNNDIKRPGKKQFEYVGLEQTRVLDDNIFKPDCIATTKKKELWVEFFVTHKVDERKRVSIQKNDIYCIEIDLRSLIDTDYSQESIYQFLVNKEVSRSWISCPVWDKERDKTLERIRVERMRIDAEEKRKKENEKIRKELEAKKLISNWMKSGDKEGAEKLVQHLKGVVCVDYSFDYRKELLQGSIWKYMERAPKTPYALNVFYQLLVQLNEKEISQEIKEQGLHLSIEESLKRNDYYKLSEQLMIYMLFVTPKQNVRVMKDGDEYIRGQINFYQLLQNYKRRRNIIKAIQTSTFINLDERIENSIFKECSDSYHNLSSQKREELNKLMSAKYEEELSKKEQQYKNPFNIAFIKDRMKGWCLSELNTKIQEYKLYLGNPNHMDNKSKIIEIIKMLEQHRTDIENQYMK